MNIQNINGTNFDLDYCKNFNPSQLEKIYNGEKKETIEMLCVRLVLEGENETNEQIKPKTSRKKITD